MSLVQSVDNVALLPAYLAALTAVAAFVTDLLLPGRRGAVLPVGALGTVSVAVAAVLVNAGGRRATFCVAGGTLPGGVPVGTSCSYVADRAGALVAVLFCVATLAVLGLSVPALRAGVAPPGEYVFLLAASLTGGVVLGYSRDLITLLVALETLTLPLYALIALRRGSARQAVDAAGGALTFFAVSVVATTVTLLGAALLYALTGAVHLDRIAAALAARPGLHHVPLTAAAVVLVLVGLAFKVAAVPFHGWAPVTYDGAPLPVAAYLSTASKLGGVVALLYVVVDALRPALALVGPALAVLAVATMTVGNLLALRQRRMVRLLAASSIAQAGYLLAPLGALVAAAGRAHLPALSTGVLGYTIFYLLLELGAFAAVVALRGAGPGGELSEYAGVARRHRFVGAALVLALVGLAGLPPGLAGLFAKITVVRASLVGGAAWLAVLIGLNAVVALAYYLRVAVLLYRPDGTPDRSGATVPLPVAAVLAAATTAALVLGFAPQLVLSAADVLP
jgi:NADH-quinone oxidoreductase subunit N